MEATLTNTDRATDRPLPTTDAAFEQLVRDFALMNCPQALRAKVAANVKPGRDELLAWQQILHQRGWGAPGWPEEFGGTGWSPERRLAFERTLAMCDCPPQPHQGLRHIGPVLMRFGTQDQQNMFLPRILSGEHLWCQGFSEPMAGSDLAALGTRASLDGDDYVVSGQKLWTSHAHEADLMFALVRTGAAGGRREGITLLLIPMDTAGVTVKEIRSLDGWHHVNEVFFDGVRVPASLRVGGEGEGWDIARFLLDRERLGPIEWLPGVERLLHRVRALAPAGEDPSGQLRLASRLLLAEAHLAALTAIGESALQCADQPSGPGLAPSILKLGWSQVAQEIGEVALDIVGSHHALLTLPVGGLPRSIEETRGAVWQNYFLQRAYTIYGGSSEIQKNLLARGLFEHAQPGGEPLFPGDLHASADRFARKHEPVLSNLTGADRSAYFGKLWSEAASLGWLDVFSDEDRASATDNLGALVEGLGSQGLALPISLSNIAAALLKRVGAAPDAVAPALDGIVAGRLRPCTVLHHLPRCRVHGGDLVVDAVIEGACAPSPTHVLVACRDPEGLQHLVLLGRDAPGVLIEDFAQMDGSSGARVTLTRVSVAAWRVGLPFSPGDPGWRHVVAVSAAMACIETQAMLGCVVQDVITHLATRVQFGKPLSQQQVLRHKTVEIYLAWQYLRALCARALKQLHAPQRGFRDVMLAAIQLQSESRRVANTAIQLHGGLGICEEVRAARLARQLVTAPLRILPFLKEYHETTGS